MRCFIYGFIGFFLAAFVFAIAYASYGDYLSESQMDRWCVTLKDTISQINDFAEIDGSLTDISSKVSNIKYDKKFNITTNMLLDNGTVIIQGGYKNQLMVIAPSITDTEISWQAFMAPAKLVPSSCNSLPNKVFNMDLQDASRIQAN